MMDVRFVANIKIRKEPNDNSKYLEITIACQTKCSNQVDDDDDFVQSFLMEDMPVDVPKHKIRQTLFVIFRDVYHEIKANCLAFLQKHPKRVARKTAPQDMDADAWEIVARKWRNHEIDECVETHQVAIASLQDVFAKL
jgi:hypothetical protein